MSYAQPHDQLDFRCSALKTTAKINPFVCLFFFSLFLLLCRVIAGINNPTVPDNVFINFSNLAIL